MSRHRNVRALDADEEYDDYYSYGGQSYEEECCISPQTEAQFLYNRHKEQPSMSEFLTSPENGSHVTDENGSFQEEVCEINAELSMLDKAKLYSCIEAMQNIVGDTIPEDVLRHAALEAQYNLEIALNKVLNENAPKPQRKKNLDGSKSVLEKNQPEIKVLNEKLESFNYKKYPTSELVIKNDVKSGQTNSKSKRNATNELIKDSTGKCKNQGLSDTTCGKAINSEPEIVLSAASSRDPLQIYSKERGAEKSFLNLVVIGHVDAGKSTLMGHLLYSLGQVSKKAMHKFEQDSKKIGKASFMYAWVLDETSEERTRGITMDVAQTKFETTNKTVTLLDAPGHKDFIPNMITGAAQADVAILVVDATKGEFETGFEAGGQTREHTLLIRSLGVSQLAVAVNKMDNVNWSQERYNIIVSKMSSFLKQVGFKESDVVFVPCSGLTGENLISSTQSPELLKWYTSPSLVDVIDNFQQPERLVKKPLRICVNDIFKGSFGGFCVSGKVESGYAKSGDKVLVMPAGNQVTIKSISINEYTQQHAFAGDQVVVQLNGLDMNNIACGSMICDLLMPVNVTSHFEARLVVFNVESPITRGYPVILHYKSVSEEAIVKKLIFQLNRSTGEVVKRNPRFISKNCSAVVEIEVIHPLCIELYQDIKDLGRFMLRSGGSTIAAGLVTKIL